MNAPVPRAGLVPIGRVRALEGIDETVQALPVSLGEAAATHVLLVADPLPASLAASAITSGGRLLFGRPASSSLAEGGEPFPDPARDGYSIKLKDVAAPIAVTGRGRRVTSLLSMEWTLADRRLARPEMTPIDIRLEPSTDIEPVTGVILSGRDLAELEERLNAWPESRFQDVRFMAIDREIILRGASLDAIPGEAFHAVDLPGGKTLMLPLGARLFPAFARAWLEPMLDPAGDLHFWRSDRILAVDSRALAPLTRRNWRAHERR